MKNRTNLAAINASKVGPCKDMSRKNKYVIEFNISVFQKVVQKKCIASIVRRSS